MTRAALRAIPSVDKVLQSLGETGLPRPLVVDAVRRELKALRSQKAIPTLDGVLAAVRSGLQRLSASRIRPVINGTGILIHTNLGRAPLGAGAVEALSSVGAHYSSLEYDLTDGTRSGRAEYLRTCLAVLCGAEAAAVVNNNAAALVLILGHYCREHANEVVISRGELLQIGGGFRIPDLLESSGATLREVGTTNHTTSSDYAKALGKRTALVLKVHRSNFFMEGFVESPSTQEIAALTRRKRIPFVEDLGSGAIFHTDTVEGIEHEPTPAEVLRLGVDLVCFSGDKLLGGPQAGVITGRRTLVAALMRTPLYRALRCDKLVLSALEATVDLYLRGGAGIPVLDMMQMSLGELRTRAERIIAALEGQPLVARVGMSRAQIGGGTLPRSSMPSIALDLTHPTLKPTALAARLRAQTLPVIGYIGSGRVRIDLRTVFPRQDEDLIATLRSASAPE